MSAGAGSVSNDRQQAPPEPAAPAIVRGGLVGRYIVLGLLGKGGMGVVYSAYDPELDRKVALKLLRVTTRRRGEDFDAKRMRLLREAKAIARLSHPSVVVVYDVGTYEDQVFIAMELVDGLTIPRWIEAKKPKWREVLRVFVDAGEGIAAAHAADLIHRDLKPENFMVTSEGKVRVMDFGLARTIDRFNDDIPLEQTADGDGPTLPGVRPPEERLTHEGNVVGTPAYMPPEQYLGVTDERSDQFSFCVSLYEMIYGQHPFEARTPFGLTGNIQAGRVHDAPARTKVPLWLRKILLRGMRPRPEDRYASMSELLAALRKDPSVMRKYWLIAGTVFAAAGALAFGLQRATDAKRAFCAAGPEKLSGAWELPGRVVGGEGPRHAAVRQAFLATGKPYAPDAVRGVTKLLDDYATKWVGLYRDSCEATQVRGEQSAELLDLRTSCLNDRLGGLRALTDVFSTATGEVVEHAIDAAHALTPLDGCSDVKQLRSLIPPPDSAVKARVEQIRRELAQIKAVHDAGKYTAAVDRLKPVLREAQTLGYRPLEAEVLTRLGTIESELARFSEAETTLQQALNTSVGSHHDDLLPEISAWLIWVTGYQRRFAEADHWRQFADSTIERSGASQSITYAWLLNNVGVVYILEGRLPEALEYCQKGKDLKEQLLGPNDPDVAISLGNISLALNNMGRLNEALERSTASLHILERAVGASHPKVAMELSNNAEVLLSLGRAGEALAEYRRALNIWQQEFGQEETQVAYGLTGSGRALIALGREDEAIEPLRRALSIRERLDRDPSRLSETEFALAMALQKRQSPNALSMARRALDHQKLVRNQSTNITKIATWISEHS
ncbi:MAG TPA: serine/threonine-protein kinase [Polyangia bacterium]|nr:serine/threonine-protein kinase [Polyangia bacterium]